MAESTALAPRRHAAWWAIVAVAAVVTGGAVILVVTTSDSSSRSSPPTSLARFVDRPVPSGQAAGLVVHDGDTVVGDSGIEAAPGRPVRFCDPYASVITESRAPCPGVEVVGVDLHRLSNRRTIHGTAYGDVTLTGVYRNGKLTVTSQGPPGPDPDRYRSQYIPCKPPSGGWVARTPTLGLGNPYVDINLFPAVRYQRSHPGAMLKLGALRASPSVAVAYVITPGDPSRVRKALSPRYPKALCVIRSRFTKEQLIESLAALKARTTVLTGGSSLYAWDALGEGNAVGPDGQLCITFDVPLMSADLAGFIDSQPTGIISMRTFLRPVASLDRD